MGRGIGAQVVRDDDGRDAVSANLYLYLLVFF